MHNLFRSPISLVALLSVVALVGVLVFQYALNTSHISMSKNSNDDATYQHLDSDDDGIPDWQELLIGTDPHNPDSNGDGVPDTYTPLPTMEEIANTTTPEESPLTVNLANEFVSRYLDLTTEGYTSEKGKALGSELAQRISTSTTYHVYTEEDVIVDKNSSYDFMLKYRANLRTALAPLLENTTPEFELYGRVIASGDSTALAELYRASERYDAAAKNMMEVRVPQEAIGSHIAAANSLTHFAAILREMVRTIHDPIASAALVREYNIAERSIFDAFNLQATYFTQKYRAHVSYEAQ